MALEAGASIFTVGQEGFYKMYYNHKDPCISHYYNVKDEYQTTIHID